MYAPPWRIWLVTFLIIAWAGLAMRFFLVKHDPVLGSLATVLALMNAFFLWQMTRRRRE
ncbi:hypothetical protein GCM10017783_24490 [Deinococcus piscis]|uniref:Uncharacterized protein n=1 Tax=Deinococcus piscis TaxID=394230 RepID=A0ABQ3KBU6_9DEIO|nr:hypothetical protein [Deinococcus piscis]GHG11237.1 hypothetical protein GCM10017783_24490 [Deinococcus piscis]